jgi:hypothetical protein
LHRIAQPLLPHTGTPFGTDGQTVPQALQLLMSASTLMHLPLHATKPSSHLMLHALFEHSGRPLLGGAPQVLPQSLQFLGSDAGLMQLPSQSLVFAGHALSHFPPEQTSLSLHA